MKSQILQDGAFVMKKFTPLLASLMLLPVQVDAGEMEQMLIEQSDFIFWYNTIGQQSTPKLPKLALNNTKKSETKQIAKGISMKITKASLDNWLGQVDIKCVNINNEAMLNKCMTVMLVSAYATDTQIDQDKMQETLMLTLKNGGGQYLDRSTNIEYNFTFNQAEKQLALNIQHEGGYIIKMGE